MVVISFAVGIVLGAAIALWGFKAGSKRYLGPRS